MRIVFDAGPLISLSNTCLLGVLDYIDADFLITPAVYKEVYLYPVRKKMYSWSARQIESYIGKKLKLRSLTPTEMSLVEELGKLLNSAFYTSRGPIKILHPGELEAVVLASRTDKLLVMDERTLRLVIEDPELLRARLSRKIHRWVKVDKRRLEEGREIIKDIFVVRSVDLVAYAYEKGFLRWMKDDREALRSALYSLKYGGCAVSEGEIELFMKHV